MNASSKFTPWPQAFIERYERQGYWTGQYLEDALLKHAEDFPNKVVFSDAGRTSTYSEFVKSVDVLARTFLADGLEEGDAVVLHMPNCIEFYESFFACLKIGVKPVLALPLHRFNEVHYFCGHVGAVRYITKVIGRDCPYRKVADQLISAHAVKNVTMFGDTDDGDKRSVSFLAAQIKKIENIPPKTLSTHSDVAFFLLSGGTTGTPKLIPRTHDDYLYSIRASVNVCELSHETVYLAVMPISHNFILSSPGALGVMHNGGTIIIADNVSPDDTFALIEKHSISHAALVPPVAITWLNAADRLRKNAQLPDISSLKVLQVGGSKLSHSVAETVPSTLGCQLQQVFGMAEGLVNYTRLDDSQHVIFNTQGKPMSDGDDVLIVDDQDQPLPDGEEGHLLTRGPYTIRGYFDAPDHNARSFTQNGFYRTGDIAVRMSSGHLTVTGRSKDQINRGGEKISAEEIENYYLKSDDVLDVAVVSMPDEYLGERSCAFVVSVKQTNDRKEKMLMMKDMKTYLNQFDIASYKIPDRIELVNELPKTKFGKVDKRALRGMISEKVS